jgi:hypothetical protein
LDGHTATGKLETTACGCAYSSTIVEMSIE